MKKNSLVLLLAAGMLLLSLWIWEIPPARAQSPSPPGPYRYFMGILAQRSTLAPAPAHQPQDTETHRVLPQDTRQQATDTTDPAVYPWPNVTRPGIYLAYDYDGHDPDTYATVGSLASFHWAQLEPEPGRYTFEVIDTWLNKLAARGLKGAFFVDLLDSGCDGDRSLPAYIRNDPQMAVRRDLGYTCTRSGRTWKALPNYINPQLQERYRQLIFRLGERYKNDPRIEYIAIGTGIYGETRAAADLADRDALARAGLTPERWVEFCNKVTDWYIQAFSDARGRLLKPLMQQTGPVTFTAWERQAISQYAVERGVGVSLNLMYPDGEGVLYEDQPPCPMCGWYDYPLRYWLAVPTAWEAYEVHTCTPTLIWWGLYNTLNKHPVYLRLAWPLVQTRNGAPRPENIAPFAWAAPYFGVTAQTAPSAWVALREHRDPFYPLQCVEDMRVPPHQHPQWGNYAFFLDQRDDLPGGRTVPETNDPRVRRMGTNLAPYNPNLPPGKEGWATRRTDYHTGNPYMFFALDDDFAQGTRDTLQVRVTYWDIGRDAWRLRYLDAAGNIRNATTASGEDHITKEDTRTWKTVTLYLHNVALTNALPEGYGGADFYLDSMNDGDEWIHFVEVVRTWDAGLVQRPTPVVWQPTATPTPTPVPPGAYHSVVASRQTTGITLDGDTSEWGDPLAVLDVTTADHVDGERARADARVILWAAWNDEGLTLAFRVYDDIIKTDSILIWRDDSIEIGIDADHDHRFTWNGPDFQFTVDAKGRWARMGKDDPDPYITRAVQRYTDGWAVEIQFPWSVLRIPAGTPGRVLGFTFGYHDDDDGGNWDTYLVWAGSRTNTSDASYGHLILGQDTGTVSYPPPLPTPGNPLNPTPQCFRRVEGRVFWDTNRNGKWDAGEQGIPGAAVILQGPITASTNTRAKGNFTFVGVPQGSYLVAATVPEGAQQTTPNPRSLTVPAQRCVVIENVDFGVYR